MGEIVLARIDDRLIHGQVMTAWLQFTGGNHIVIVDDATAGDEFTKSIMSMAVPSGIKLSILGIDDGAALLANVPDGHKIIVLAKEPQTYLSLIEKGVKFEEIIIGGMGARKDRKTFHKNISASEEEKEAFRKIVGNDVKMKIHVIPDQGSQAIEGLL
ncbi:PTS sugar transporter subunit IIB [Enterococcus hulanensis]|uniref:PTS sugar transporter subunit IIB n=1 Tax=Enterococcus hulanensis TaxID=2559929 RepID=A0ABU3EZN2_9ENTE|nr:MULTISPECIES: PTS sugar transporter subunit IIB [Enterococcus]MBO0409792.1 PTS sugar transporter subunit IIB [Enterococcus hulanensis]MBO0456663.1 PTS sugar transporter subunit IIB [Enterococcus hulanensis]MDT2600328.1 PTS sugar transporter subunit IIB [Enterococcus hulanensis]MDT2609141.1 PTS sugar transporter subunit IIB [Enterococcus hulanensis]MDT2616817.1 PTS sugar transporter subunit IIB [Enterococcus hulanensis]